MRRVILTVALLFIGGLAALTIIDMSHYGVSAIDVLAILVLVLFMTGIVGALRQPPAQ